MRRKKEIWRVGKLDETHGYMLFRKGVYLYFDRVEHDQAGYFKFYSQGILVASLFEMKNRIVGLYRVMKDGRYMEVPTNVSDNRDF